MQDTRRHILEILKNHSEATVDEVVDELRQRRSDHITPVTVRHHLKILQDEGMVDSGKMRQRTSPGRPQHVYYLTERGLAYFPGNYQRLVETLLRQMESNLPPGGVNVILEGVATSMAETACIPQAPLEERLSAVVEYLNRSGYEAHYEPAENGYVLATCNCPYHHLSRETDSLCQMDMRLISNLLGVVPRLISRIAQGEDSCSYFIPAAVIQGQ
jgi:DeoR family transcriptional regulator, suf operon transcriptional repressor